MTACSSVNTCLTQPTFRAKLQWCDTLTRARVESKFESIFLACGIIFCSREQKLGSVVSTPRPLVRAHDNPSRRSNCPRQPLCETRQRSRFRHARPLNQPRPLPHYSTASMLTRVSEKDFWMEKTATDARTTQTQTHILRRQVFNFNNCSLKFIAFVQSLKATHPERKPTIKRRWKYCTREVTQSKSEDNSGCRTTHMIKPEHWT